MYQYVQGKIFLHFSMQSENKTFLGMRKMGTQYIQTVIDIKSIKYLQIAEKTSIYLIWS